MTQRKFINAATIASRIEFVLRRQRRLNALLDSEHQKPAPDPWILQMLDREQIRMKEILGRYEGLHQTLSRGRAA